MNIEKEKEVKRDDLLGLAQFEYDLTHVTTIASERKTRDELTEEEYQVFRQFILKTPIFDSVNHILDSGVHELRYTQTEGRAAELPLSPE